MNKSRLEAFSDGVFAIVVTLLVLEIHVPRVPGAHTTQELWAAVLALAPKVGTWALSFVFATIYWVNHHQFVAILSRVDRVILFLNALFLLALSFLPFPTALLGEYPREMPALAVFGVSMAAIGSAFLLLRVTAARRGLLPHVPPAMRRRAENRGAIGPALYLLGAGASLAEARIAWAIYLLIPILYVGANAAERHAGTG